MRSARRARLRAAAAVGLSLTVAGCAADGTGRGSAVEPPEITLTRVTSDDQVVTPAVRLLPDHDQAAQILLAYDTLLARCVAQTGRDLGMSGGGRPAWVTQFVAPFAGPQPLGPVDPQRMATHGYHDPRGDPHSGEQVQYVGDPTPPDVIATCDESVAEELGGAPQADLRPVIAAAGKAAAADPRLIAPQKAWQRCMADRGLDYETSADAVVEFVLNDMQSSTGIEGTAWGQNLPPREIAVAVADAECQEQSRNIDTQVAVLSAYEEAALDAHAELVADYERDKDRLVSAAAHVVATYPPPANRVVWDRSKGGSPPPPG